jgi:hypothetical protein
MQTSFVNRMNYILRSLTAGGTRNIFKGFRLWRERVRKRNNWLQTHDMELRIQDVLSCPDLASIPIVPEAGKIHDGILTMHNGLKVISGSYSGDAMTRLLQRTKGIHEPQEEKVFAEVLKHISEGSSILELGAWWGFYSMWFKKEVPYANLYLIEPSEENLKFGVQNIELNDMSAQFFQAFIGNRSEPSPNATSTISIDDAFQTLKIDSLAILHCDIQGHEFAMLEGAKKSIANRLIDYFFVSTHTTNLHYACLDLLQQSQYEILAHADMLDTYSYDGFIAARRMELSGCPKVKIVTR